MVLYFSATGNTEFIAKELAERKNDECVNLLERIKSQDFSPIHSEKPFVICAPVYVCEIPRFMTQYLKELSFTGSKDVYFILTSGGYCGPSGILLKKIFKAKKMICHGHAEFKMPRNYVASDDYPMLEKPEVEERITNSYNQLQQVATDILAGNKLTAKDFYVEEACMGCGKCEKLCPLNNIKLVDKKPVWGNQCTHCMACISNCPVNAIQYGNITQEKEPYNFGKYKYVVKNLEQQSAKK